MSIYASQLLEKAVDEMSKLPGIGQKTALRLVLHLLREDKGYANALGEAIIKLRNEIKFCQKCHNVSDNDLCEICANPKRNEKILCIVADTRDVMAIENTTQFNGIYHILGGIISPMEGIGPQDLNLQSLLNRVDSESFDEVLMALPPTVEGDTTNFYIYRQIGSKVSTITTIARGISIGDELEYTDEVTLGRSILNRLPYEQGLK